MFFGEFLTSFLNLFVSFYKATRTTTIFQYLYAFIDEEDNIFCLKPLKAYIRYSFYNSEFFANLSTAEQIIFAHEDLSSTSRFKKAEHFIFKYDYKAGDYFPKLSKEIFFF
jgi:ABC-type branched-subunit amino acid transport system ATPase component